MLLLNTKVRCLGIDICHPLKDTWFPSKEIVQYSRQHGVAEHMGILALPDSENGTSIEDWFSLRDLGINYQRGLKYYECVLTAMARNLKEPPQTVRMHEFYDTIGSLATLQDKVVLQSIFKDKSLLWDPQRKTWHPSIDCVWKSEVSLTRRFVIQKAYPSSTMAYFATNLLGIVDASINDYLSEIDILSSKDLSKTDAILRMRVNELYTTLEKLAESEEQQKQLRDTFRSQPLIYYEGSWYKSSACVWHESVTIGGHVPIKGAFPGLERLFTKILQLKMVTTSFMMAELARAATKASPDHNNIKQLMLKTSAMLPPADDHDSYKSSLEKLRTANYLPCKKADGELICLPSSGAFHIIDDTRYAEVFRGKLCFLDFTYSEFNTLYNLILLLRLEEHCLSPNVRHLTQEGESTIHGLLTEQLRECAFAVSCCAVYHHSPLYHDHQTSMHDSLMKIVVKTSLNMSTTFCVKEGDKEVEIEADKPSFIISKSLDILQIVVPDDTRQQQQFYRSKLPDELVRRLQISSAQASRQIARVINELDISTDDVLEQEGIPHAPWLSKTDRVVEYQLLGAAASASLHTPSSTAATSESTQEIWNAGDGVDHPAENLPEILVSSTEVSAGYHYQARRYWIPIPAEVNHRVEAPQYWRVLEHVRREAVNVRWRNALQQRISSSTNDHVRYLTNLRDGRGDSIDPARYTELFGSDQFVNFRIGAAGELFAFEVLKSLLGNDITTHNWQSTIRHYVRALEAYQNIERWTARETADITYLDEACELPARFGGTELGDSFTDWLPDWLSTNVICTHGSNLANAACACQTSQTSAERLEWLFEVKTTLGPCETEFFMSQSQYSRMRAAGNARGSDRKQVYCIIRVYDLLKPTVGVRIYIDPWRFRDTKLDFNTTDKWRVKAIRG